MQPPAEWVPFDASGRRLALTRWGMGAPTVVFETGLGAESADWEPVQREVATFTATCRYDRANRGDSDPAPTPRSAREFVGDLHALLDTAAIPGPYVLVGHSLGGVIVRLYAHEYPDDVAGVVLVDPMHEDQFEQMAPLIPPPFPGEPDALTQFRRFWTEEWRDPMKNPEGVDFQANQVQLQAVRSLGDLPLLVLTASDFLRMAPPGAPEAARMQQRWQELHRELLLQSSNAQQMLVETSGHFIQREQPEVVVAAIRQQVGFRHAPVLLGQPGCNTCDVCRCTSRSRATASVSSLSNVAAG